MKFNIQLFGGRGASSGKQSGVRLTKNEEKGAISDIRTYLKGNSGYEGSQQDFIRDLSNECGIDRSRAKQTDDNTTVIP